MQSDIMQHSRPSIYMNNYTDYNIMHSVIFHSYVNDSSNVQIFKENLHKHDYCLAIYTDASKTSNTLGLAFVVPRLDVSVSYSSDCRMTIYSTAVLEALKWVMSHRDEKNVLVVSDCQPVLKSIVNARDSRNVLIHQIIGKLADIRSQDRCVYFLWAKAHCGIEGNDRADSAAKSPESVLSCKTYCLDFLNGLRREVFARWSNDYRVVASSSCSNYYSLHPGLPCRADLDYIFLLDRTRFFSLIYCRNTI